MGGKKKGKFKEVDKKSVKVNLENLLNLEGLGEEQKEEIFKNVGKAISEGKDAQAVVDNEVLSYKAKALAKHETLHSLVSSMVEEKKKSKNDEPPLPNTQIPTLSQKAELSTKINLSTVSSRYSKDDNNVSSKSQKQEKGAVPKDIEKDLEDDDLEMSNVGSRLNIPSTSIKHGNMYEDDGNSQSPRNSGAYEPITAAQLHPLSQDGEGYSRVASEPKLAKSKNEENLEYIDKFLMDFGQAGKEKIDATMVELNAELKQLNKDIEENKLRAQKRNVQEIVKNASGKAGIASESTLPEQNKDVKVESVAEVAARVVNKRLGPVVAQEVKQLMEKPIEGELNLSEVKLTSTDKLRVLGERFKLFCKHCHEYVHRKSDGEYVSKNGSQEQKETSTLNATFVKGNAQKSIKNEAKRVMKSLANDIFTEKYKNIPKEAEENIKKERLLKQKAKDLEKGFLPM